MCRGEEGPTEGARWEVSMSSAPGTDRGVSHKWTRFAPLKKGILSCLAQELRLRSFSHSTNLCRWLGLQCCV